MHTVHSNQLFCERFRAFCYNQFSYFLQLLVLKFIGVYAASRVKNLYIGVRIYEIQNGILDSLARLTHSD